VVEKQKDKKNHAKIKTTYNAIKNSENISTILAKNSTLYFI
jgi:hypothetical protein